MHIDDGVGIILVGDILQVAPGADAVSFMWSYPNMLPLPASAVIHIMRALQDVRFDRLYGAFEGQDIKSNVRQIVVRTVQKYLACLRKE